MLPERYVLIILIVIGTIFLASMHVTINVAIVAMVNHTAISEFVEGTQECKNQKPITNETELNKDGPFIWDPAIQGIILAAFTYGVPCTVLIGGILAHKCGPKWVIIIGALLSSVFTSLIPTASELGAGILVLVRFLQGLALGVITPALYYLISNWSRPQERSTTVTIMTVGTIVGGFVSSLATGYLAETDFLGGWPSVFYLPAIGTGVWVIFWIVLVHDTPERHPRISEKEILLIRSSGTSKNLRQNNEAIPWKSILLSVPIWALLLIRFAHVWTLTTLQMAFPLYMDLVLGINIKKNGAITGALYSVTLIAILYGLIADAVKRKTGCSTTTLRKVFCFIAYVGCSSCFVAIPFAGCNLPIMLTLLFSAKAFFVVSLAGDSVVIMDMAPNLSGTIYGATSTVANTAGFLSPMFTGFVTDNDMSIDQWKNVFFTVAAINIICLVIFLIFGSAKVQPWAVKVTTDGEKQPLLNDPEEKYGSLFTSYESPILCASFSKTRQLNDGNTAGKP